MPGSQSTLQAFTNTFPTLPEMEVSSLFPARVFNWKCHSMRMETDENQESPQCSLPNQKQVITT